MPWITPVHAAHTDVKHLASYGREYDVSYDSPGRYFRH